MALTGLEKTANELSDIERTTLAALSTEQAMSLDEIASRTKLNTDSVRRSAAWLSEKKLAILETSKTEKISLTQAGKSSLSNGLPEKLFVEALVVLGKNASLEQAYQKSQLNRPEFNAAMGLAKKNAWISIQKQGNEIRLSLTGLEQELLEGKNKLENAIKQIADGKSETIPKQILVELKKRGLAESKTMASPSLRLASDGQEILPLLSQTTKRSYDIAGQVPDQPMGKKHPYIQFLNQCRRKLVEVGFIEMDAPLITQEFYNFDVLFQPQNHPARSWTDTYQLKQPQKGTLPNPKLVQAIQAMHETGGVSASNGWQYSWEQEIAKRLMPTGHTTAHSARQLVKGIKIPGKYFAIARCFRPDVINATHLIEFNQMEGFIVGENLNFRHLLGILKEFAIEFSGATQVKFCPSYYPFTEPSVQLNVKHPDLGWMELGGAGMFRPEMLENLGIDGQALAWGLGIDRLAMIKLGITDIRQLFSDDLNWLRKQPHVQTNRERK